MITAVTEAGVEVIDIVPAPLASAVVTLTVPQKWQAVHLSILDQKLFQLLF